MLEMLTSIMDMGGSISDRMGNIGALKSAATMADVESESIMAAAKFNAEQAQKSGDKFVSRQIASYAKAGVRFEGSPAMVVADTYRTISLNKAIEHQNAVSSAISKGFEASNLRMRAGFEKVNMWGDVGQGLLKIGASAALKAEAGKVSNTSSSRELSDSSKMASGDYSYTPRGVSKLFF